MSNNRTNYEKIDIARVQEYIDDVFKDQKSISRINEFLKEIAKKGHCHQSFEYKL